MIPPMEEKEMTKTFLKTLGAFYYERMVASAPSDFTEMVGMGIRLEEALTLKVSTAMRKSITTKMKSLPSVHVTT